MASAQLTPFQVGQVKAHMEHGLGCKAISERVFKADGKTHFGETAIVNCMNRLKKNPRWTGERKVGSGAPRKTTAAQDKKVVAWVLKERGKQKVTVAKIKKEFPHLRKVSDSLVEERLAEADLVFLRRRNKCRVGSQYLDERLAYCESVKRKHQSTLNKWAYTDGTLFYLDRSTAEAEDSKRRTLGTHVWRRSENKDAMHQDCLGPSSYSKGQGIPVKVWGTVRSFLLLL